MTNPMSDSKVESKGTAAKGRPLGDAEVKVIDDTNAALQASDFRRAADLANLGIRHGMIHPALFSARAFWLQENGRHEHALEDFRRALTLSPQNPASLVAIGLCLMDMDRASEAVEYFDAALAIEPTSTRTLYRRGLALAKSGNHQAAQEAYEQILVLEPDHPQANASLASIAGRKGELEKARFLAARALEGNPHESTAKVALAITELAEKKFAAAELRLRQILQDDNLNASNRSAVYGLLGDSLDNQQRYPEAFDAYVKENEDLRRVNAQKFSSGRAIEAVRQMTAYFQTAPAADWRTPDDGGHTPGEARAHIFLLGFMRSGTTLLEQVLASNPDIVALEEKNLLNEPGDVFLTSAPGLDALAALDGAELTRHRQAYWDRVRAQGLDVKGKVFIDKQPLNTVKLPLMTKLFPRSKILFALRDPRDVVFSCFRRHFNVNIMMYEFLSLHDAADFYSSVMGLGALYREKLALNILDHRYEDMVQDFDGSVRRVCDFIGTSWADSMRNFNVIAPNVDLRSPSARQVTRPLYGEGMGQWRNYVRELAPIMPILRPWVEAFGYSAE